MNDNFGRWRSNFIEVLERCLGCGGDVKTFIEYALPYAEDYLVLKPKHSGFYYTPLELLLRDLGQLLRRAISRRAQRRDRASRRDAERRCDADQQSPVPDWLRHVAGPANE